MIGNKTTELIEAIENFPNSPTVSEIAAYLNKSISTVSERLNAASKKGLIELRPDPVDNRFKHIYVLDTSPMRSGNLNNTSVEFNFAIKIEKLEKQVQAVADQIQALQEMVSSQLLSLASQAQESDAMKVESLTQKLQQDFITQLQAFRKI